MPRVRRIARLRWNDHISGSLLCQTLFSDTAFHISLIVICNLLGDVLRLWLFPWPLQFLAFLVVFLVGIYAFSVMVLVGMVVDVPFL